MEATPSPTSFHSIIPFRLGYPGSHRVACSDEPVMAKGGVHRRRPCLLQPEPASQHRKGTPAQLQRFRGGGVVEEAFPA